MRPDEKTPVVWQHDRPHGGLRGCPPQCLTNVRAKCERFVIMFFDYVFVCGRIHNQGTKVLSRHPVASRRPPARDGVPWEVVPPMELGMLPYRLCGCSCFCSGVAFPWLRCGCSTTTTGRLTIARTTVRTTARTTSRTTPRSARGCLGLSLLWERDNFVFTPKDKVWLTCKDKVVTLFRYRPKNGICFKMPFHIKGGAALPV